MKCSQMRLCAVALILMSLQTSLWAFEPKLKIVAPKDRVLGLEKRQAVVELGKKYLTPPNQDFLALIDGLRDPFAFKTATPVEPVQVPAREVEPVVEEVAVQYEAAEVLALSVANFAKKVRGTISRGDSNYLQLEGGVLLQPGSSFPVRLPQAENQTFMLSITEIDSTGYTLQIGEANTRVNFNNAPQSNSVIEFSNP